MIEINLRRFWHAPRRNVIAAFVVLSVLAAMVHSAAGGTEPRAQVPSRAAACEAAHRAVHEIATRYPDTPQETLDAIGEQVCRMDLVPAPTTKPSAVVPSPGCHLRSGTDRRSPKRVGAAKPTRLVPFFAARSGRLPRTGAPRLGDVRLPAGSRCGPFWSTDAGVPDSFALARKLAAIFPSTGLWPLIWAWPDEEPDAYVNAGKHLVRVQSLDAQAVLRRAWHANGAERRPFPGLAAAQPAAKRQAVEPFGEILEASLDEQPPGGPILMLVPVNRPADVMSVLGLEQTMYFSDEEQTAVLRSWEERFGAVVSTISPGGVDLVAGAPPRDDEQLNQLVAEHATFAPDLWTAADLEPLLRSGARREALPQRTTGRSDGLTEVVPGRLAYEHMFVYAGSMPDYDLAQRAVLAALLEAHPRLLGIDELDAMLADIPRVREALRVLADDGLATKLGDRVGVSRAAVRFDALSR